MRLPGRKPTGAAQSRHRTCEQARPRRLWLEAVWLRMGSSAFWVWSAPFLPVFRSFGFCGGPSSSRGPGNVGRAVLIDMALDAEVVHWWTNEGARGIFRQSANPVVQPIKLRLSVLLLRIWSKLAQPYGVRDPIYIPGKRVGAEKILSGRNQDRLIYCR